MDPVSLLKLQIMTSEAHNALADDEANALLVTQRVIDVVYEPKAETKKNENTEKPETISSKLNQFSSTDNNLIIKSVKGRMGSLK
ncbi:hypothetical protein R6Q57_028377 [Mikania cordata]